jgi:hypothetical protein
MHGGIVPDAVLLPPGQFHKSRNAKEFCAARTACAGVPHHPDRILPEGPRTHSGRWIPMPYGEYRDAAGLTIDRRMAGERRRPHLLSDWTYAWRGKRRAPRRPGDEFVASVDLYHPRLMALVIAISILNALDATFTLRLVSAGVAEEWNPFMRVLLQDDVQLFVNLKVAITSSALLFLVVCSNMVILRGVRVERLLHWLLGAYLAVVGYHLVLLGASGV